MKKPFNLFGFGLLVILIALLSNFSAFAKQPNIILIMSDDMGHSDLGCYGGEIRTPTLDGLAEGGVRFTQFYNTARCCPTRASLLTGLHPHQAGMGHMTGAGHRLPGYRGDLLPNTVTIAEVLKTAGYMNYCIGKWHVTDKTSIDAPKENWPIQRGFDRCYGLIHGAANYFDPALLVRDNTVISAFDDPEYTPEKEYYLTTALSDNAAKFITEHKENSANQPFFMYVAYTAAHWPMHAPDDAIAKYQGKYDAGYQVIRQARYEKMKAMKLIPEHWELTSQAENWDNVKNKDWEARCMEVYAAMISEMDAGIGQIVDTLKKTGQYDDTVILFLQDNGACAENVGRQSDGKLTTRPSQPTLPPIPRETVIDKRSIVESQTRDGYPVIRGTGVMPGPKDTFIAYGRGWANVSNTPFREYKHWVHEGGISTPLIVHAPKIVAESMKGQFYREPGQLIDLMATCIDLAGATYPKEHNGYEITPATGTSLVPGFSGQSLGRQLPLLWEHEGNRAIREGNMKLVAKGPLGSWELYDMEADRSELHDLAGKYPDRVEELSKKWRDWAVSAMVLPWPWDGQGDIKPDTTPGLKLEFDFSQDKQEITDSSGCKNVFSIEGKLPVIRNETGNARYFDGQSCIQVEKSAALCAAQTPWRIEAVIRSETSDGQILAYGGSRHGYSLFIQSGKPGFAVRLNEDLHVIRAETPITGKTSLKAVITPQKKLELYVDEKLAASAVIPDFLLEEPAESMQIGTDHAGNVAGVKVPNFKGQISRIAVYREPTGSR